jgi:methionine-rich copper-binding protein CopC
MKTSPFAVVLAVLMMLVLATPAQAHTALRRSDPKKGAEVTGLDKVTLVFTESVRFPVVVVNGPGAKRYEAGKPKVDGPKVIQNVVTGLPAGNYTIAWRVVADDGHPVEGEIPFTVVGTPTPSPSATSPGSADPTAPVLPSQPQTTSPSELSQGTTSGGGVPAWVWVVVFGLGGIGIGMAYSLRKKS